MHMLIQRFIQRVASVSGWPDASGVAGYLRRAACCTTAASARGAPAAPGCSSLTTGTTSEAQRDGTAPSACCGGGYTCQVGSSGWPGHALQPACCTAQQQALPGAQQPYTHACASSAFLSVRCPPHSALPNAVNAALPGHATGMATMPHAHCNGWAPMVMTQYAVT